MTEPPRMTAAQRCLTLDAALRRYHTEVCDEYDETLHEVIGHVATAGSLGKSDLGALLLWKRIRVGAWAMTLLCMADADVREITGKAVAAARDQGATVADAARSARRALIDLPGAGIGDAFASAVMLAAAPERMAVYDHHAHLGLWRVGLRLDEKPGRYGRYMELVEQCRAELLEHGYGEWTARQVELALFTHGQDESRPRRRPWRDQ
ncbi:MAG: hypothetical protein ACRDPY_40250 [Streptosporangiaceae bacterium]